MQSELKVILAALSYSLLKLGTLETPANGTPTHQLFLILKALFCNIKQTHSIAIALHYHTKKQVCFLHVSGTTEDDFMPQTLLP